MAKGDTFPSESRSYRDPQTGAEVRQVTTHPSLTHHPYFYICAFAREPERLHFVSHRTGAPNVFCEMGRGGTLLQMTDRDDLNEWSVVPSRDGSGVYFIAGGGVWAMDAETLAETCLRRIGDHAGSITGGSASCSLSANGKWLAVAERTPKGDSIVVVNTSTGAAETILERDTVMHVQFCPDDDTWIQYAGPLDQRIWVIRRDGSGNRYLYPSKPMEWVTHESWVPRSLEIVFTDWPRGLRMAHAESGKVRTVAELNAWHASARLDGTAFVCDTTLPDIGLQLVDAATGARRTLCFPGASNVGDHWAGPFPYSRKPYPKVHAPQHTHPHPSFSPDGSHVVYTSDRSGCAQVYEVRFFEF